MTPKNDSIRSGDLVACDESQAQELFLRELASIDRAIRFAIHRGAFRSEDEEEFASYVKLKLIDNGYAIIRKYEHRSTFAAFISVVVRRMLLDYRIEQWGKWHASAQARRLGEPAITIEAMMIRDGRTIDEVLPALQRRWPGITRARVDALARMLPQRAVRPRIVDVELAANEIGGTAESVDEAAFESERSSVSRRIATIVRETMQSMDEHHRLVFRLHFEGGLSVAEISRTLRIEQKPLYRHIHRGLHSLRNQLEAAGITATEVEEILSNRNTDLDFGFECPRGEDAGVGVDDREMS